MLEWHQANLASILPPAVGDAASLASDVVGTAADAMGVVADALDLAKEFLLGFPLFDWLGALADAIEDLKNDILATGIYVLPMWDYSLDIAYLQDNDVKAAESWRETIFELTEPTAHKHSFEDFVQRIYFSFVDPSDSSRPIFSEGAAVAGLVLVVAAPSGADFLKILEQVVTLWPSNENLARIWDQFLKILGGPEKDVYDRVVGYIEGGFSGYSTDVGAAWNDFAGNLGGLEEKPGDDQWKEIKTKWNDDAAAKWQTFIGLLEGESRRPPDWISVTVKDLFPPIEALLNSVLQPIIDLLRAGANFLDALIMLIETIQKKVVKLQDLLTQLSELLDLIDEMLGATGIYAVYIESAGGTEDFRTELRNAEFAPGMTALGSEPFIAGITILGGGPTLEPFRLLFGAV